MVTRVYCDHCGHAAPNAQKYIFGAHSLFYGAVDASPQGVTGILQQTTSQVNSQQNCTGNLPIPNRPPEIIRSGSVDLCNTCQIVWMNRVKALTQVSEP